MMKSLLSLLSRGSEPSPSQERAKERLEAHRAVWKDTPVRKFDGRKRASRWLRNQSQNHAYPPRHIQEKF